MIDELLDYIDRNDRISSTSFVAFTYLMPRPKPGFYSAVNAYLIPK